MVYRISKNPTQSAEWMFIEHISAEPQIKSNWTFLRLCSGQVSAQTQLGQGQENVVVWLWWPRSRVEIIQLPLKNSHLCQNKNSWKCPQINLDISTGVIDRVRGQQVGGLVVLGVLCKRPKTDVDLTLKFVYWFVSELCCFSPTRSLTCCWLKCRHACSFCASDLLMAACVWQYRILLLSWWNVGFRSVPFSWFRSTCRVFASV